jgi:hypothetical protein
MSIVSEKKFLTEEELTTLKQIQSDTRALIAELGEIELIKLQVEKRHENAKIFLNELGEKETELYPINLLPLMVKPISTQKPVRLFH